MTTKTVHSVEETSTSTWSFDDVIAALHFVAVPTNIPLAGFSIDSRTLQPGQVFVALKGENADGHDFLQQAYDKGATLALVEKSDLPVLDGRSYLCVASTQQALVDLAAYSRARSKATVTAVSGSVGKTTVRSWIASMLGHLGTTSSTIKNFNGQVGLPFSMLRLRPEDRFGVFEIGADAPGVILALSRLCQPHVAVLTPVGSAHLETFGSPENIAHEKAQLFAGLVPGGKIVCDEGSCRRYPEILALARASEAVNIVTVGFEEGASLRILDVHSHAGKTEVRVKWQNEVLSYTLGASGKAFVLDSALALAGVVCTQFEGPVEHILEEHLTEIQHKILPLTSLWGALPGRGRVFQVHWPEGATVTVVDDAYNANPESMLAGLEAFESMVIPHGGRKIAIIGDMLALGDQSEKAHDGLFERLANSSIDKVYAVGPLSEKAYQTHIPSTKKGTWSPTVEHLPEALERDLRRGDALWLKASHAIGLESVVDMLWQRRTESSELAA